MKSIKMPWRVRIAACFLRGFFTHPRKALFYGRGITLDMKSLYRFNLHIHGRKFLRDVLEEAAKLGMQPFLLWGTLLGCVREKRFLDHDYDIDMGILARDYSKKDALIRAVIARGYQLRFDRPFAFSFERKDGLLHMDIDLLYPFKQSLISAMASEKTGKISANQFPKEAFENLEPRFFLDDLRVWVPQDSDQALTSMYGDWRVPVKKYDYETGPRNQISNPATLRRAASYFPAQCWT